MRYHFLTAMLLVCTCGFAQEPALTDDLNTSMEKIAGKYQPSEKLGPVQYNEVINKIRKDAYRRIKPGNPKLTALKRLDVDYYLRGVLWEYRTFHDYGSPKGIPAAQRKYIDSLIYPNTDLDDEELYKGSETYRGWLDKYLDKIYQTKYKPDTTMRYSKGFMLPMRVVVNEIRNPVVRDNVCFQHASVYLKVAADSVQAKKIYEDFNAAITNTYYRGAIQQVYVNYKRLHIKGAPSPDFTYTAVDGNKVTLSKLRGKYVYIDVWATWCGPCKEEIPFLMKLEEKYKDKNIQFVSLSVDKQADAGVWRKYVTDNKLTGYQVMADNAIQSDFTKKMNIALIPRFILIDPAGNVVDGDAKRPLDPELKKQLDKLLGVPVAPFALSPYARQSDFSGHWQLSKTKNNLKKLSETFVSNALNVTKNENALVVERTRVNKEMKESHYSEEFMLDGTSTRTMVKQFPEVDSLESNPDIPALTLGMCLKVATAMSLNFTETWTLEDGGKTLVVDRQQNMSGTAMKGVKVYYDKQ